jgi:hypothetical protein
MGRCCIARSASHDNKLARIIDIIGQALCQDRQPDA